MCLYKITKQIAPTDEVVEAYKIVACDARGLKTWIFDIKREKSWDQDRIYPHHWYRARRTWIFLNSGAYPSGFHCFSKLSQAKKALRELKCAASHLADDYTLVRVLVKGVHTYGKEYHGSMMHHGTILSNVLVAEWVQYKEEVK